MANICDNSFYLEKIDNQEDFEKSLNNINNFIQEFCEGEVTYCDDEIAEGYFDSRWSFPMDKFEELLTGNVYFRCLSEEYGCKYVAMNVYNGEWLDEQTFDF